MLGFIAACWIKGFIVFVVCFFLSEVIAVNTRQDYMKWLQDNSSKGKSSTPGYKVVLFLLLVWPVLAYDWLKGMFKGQTLMELITLRNKDKQKALEETKKAHEVITQTVKDSDRSWEPITMGSQEFNGVALVHQAQGRVFLSHYIFIGTDNTCLCLRAMPEPAKSLPWQICPSLQAAQAKCLEDLDWSKLCIPGMESQQARIWKKVHKGMNDKLDRFYKC